MPYSTDSAKWNAYQFLDPLAANSFFVCNKVNKRFCRPNCEAYPIIELRSEVSFTKSAAQAIEHGFLSCESCDPTSTSGIDTTLLIQTITDVNALIGFTLPSFDDDDETKDMIKRRQSVLGIGEGSSLKNNSEHYRLVDLACRHLALAAAMSIMGPSLPNSNSASSDEGPASAPGKKKRKRRGGVLGFKELAAKSKLSAWHFHRVFKSVTGLTPKTYGDKCWEYLQDDSRGYKHSVAALNMNHVHHNNTGRIPEYPTVQWPSETRLTPSELDLSLSSRTASSVCSVLPNSPKKRVRPDVDEAPLPRRMGPQQAYPYATPTSATPLAGPAYALDEADALRLDFARNDDLASPYTLFPQRQQPMSYISPQHTANNIPMDNDLASSMMQPVPMQDLLAQMPVCSAMPQEAQDMAFTNFSDLFAPGNGLDLVGGTALGAGLGDDIVDEQPGTMDFSAGFSLDLLSTNII